MTMTTEIKPHVQLLTVPEAAERLGISPRKTWQLISEGQLHTVRIGHRSTRILESELEDFVTRLQEMAARRN